MRPTPDYRVVFSLSANALMLLDRELRPVDANAAFLELVGARREEVIGHHLLELLPEDPAHPEDNSARVLHASLQKVLQTRERDVIAHLRCRLPCHEGGPAEDRQWSVTHCPIFDEHGEVAYILQHVTELPREEAALAGSVASHVLVCAREVQARHDALDVETERLRRLIDQAPGFLCFLRGPEHVFELCNQAYYDLVGRRGLVGKALREALPEVGGRFVELLDQAFTSGEPVARRGVTLNFVRADSGRQEAAVVDFLFQPISDHNGRVLGLLVQGYDVTAQRRTEVRHRFAALASERLATAHVDLQAALQQVAAIAVTEFADWCFIDRFEDGRSRRIVAHADPADAELAERLQACPPPATPLPGHPALDCEARPLLLRDVDDDVLRRGPEQLALLRAVEPCSILMAPLRARGRRIGIMTLILSRSRRAYDEHDLSIAVELARLVSSAIDSDALARERNELLLREQAARERAEAANRAKDEFLALLGHELRNPLSPILTAVQLMRLRDDGTCSRERVIIERQAQHLVRLVDDLLDVSRITRGKVRLSWAPLSAQGFIARAVEIASPLLEEKRHRLRLDVAEGLRVEGDEVRLSQVVANLLTNAARYTEHGGDITLSATREGDEVVIRVCDNGIGIAPEMLPHIFEMFVQGPRRSDRAEGGLGLGLTLVRTLVGMHGGSVSAESAGVGKGSTFVVRLPVAATEEPREVLPAVRPARVQPALRILVVDDNVDAAFLLAAMLETRGHEVALAHDGPSALETARSFRPEVAVLDIGLPVMDGYELAGQLRVALAPRVPRLIALTGYGQDHHRRRSAEVGFAAHLVKPVDADELFRTLLC